MPKPILTAISSMADPLFTDHYRLTFPVIPVSLTSFPSFTDWLWGAITGGTAQNAVQGAEYVKDVLGLNAGTMTDPSHILAIHCKSATLPSKTIEPSVVELYGHKLKYAGLSTFSDTFEVEFYEDSSLVVTRILHTWMSIAKQHVGQIGQNKHGPGEGNPLSNYGLKDVGSGYAGEANLNVFDVTGNTVGSYYFYGVWPTAIGDMAFDASSCGLMSNHASFAFDLWVEDGPAE